MVKAGVVLARSSFCRQVPGSMSNSGFLLLLFPWARKLTPIASTTQLLNRKHNNCIVCNQGTAEKQLSIADVVIPVEKNLKKKRMPCNVRNMKIEVTRNKSLTRNMDFNISQDIVFLSKRFSFEAFFF